MTSALTETSSRANPQEPELPTLMDHLQELKGRFFWIAVAFIVASGLAYPRYSEIIHLLTAPMGKQELYYMTPAGGFSFIIKVCMYVGIIAVLPVAIYHLYKFITPVMKQRSAYSVMFYTLMSTILGVVGVLFAYFFTLPASLHFLNNINIDQISSMITIDAYMSFVIAYILAGALLFQTPLVMMIINAVSPLSPKKLMNYQRHMIVVSFLVAAIISPTPDVVNQTILAAPMVVMYQVGIIIIWFKNRKSAKQARRQTLVSGRNVQSVGKMKVYKKPQVVAETAPDFLYNDDLFDEMNQPEVAHDSVRSPVQTSAPNLPPLQPAPIQVGPIVVRTARSIDGVRVGSPRLDRPRQTVPARRAISSSGGLSPAEQLQPSPNSRRTIDGFMIPSL